MNELFTLSRACRKELRELAGLGPYDHPPVEIVEGSNPPRERGDSFHWETKGGTRIYHPSAYSRRGWSNMVYVGSSRRVEVGREWLLPEYSI